MATSASSRSCEWSVPQPRAVPIIAATVGSAERRPVQHLGCPRVRQDSEDESKEVANTGFAQAMRATRCLCKDAMHPATMAATVQGATGPDMHALLQVVPPAHGTHFLHKQSSWRHEQDGSMWIRKFQTGIQRAGLGEHTSIQTDGQCLPQPWMNLCMPTWTAL